MEEGMRNMQWKRNSGVWGDRLLGVLITLASLSLIVGVASFAIGRDIASDQLPSEELAAAEGFDYIDRDSARVIGSDSIAGAPGVALDFVTYETSKGRCFDVIVSYQGAEGSAGGCGGDGTSLLEGGVGSGGVTVGGQRFSIISGLLDGMPDARYVEVDMPSGDTVRMSIGSNGVYHWAVPMPDGVDFEDPAYMPTEFRVLSESGEVLDVFVVPPLGDPADRPTEYVDGSGEDPPIGRRP